MTMRSKTLEALIRFCHERTDEEAADMPLSERAQLNVNKVGVYGTLEQELKAESKLHYVSTFGPPPATYGDKVYDAKLGVNIEFYYMLAPYSNQHHGTFMTSSYKFSSMDIRVIEALNYKCNNVSLKQIIGIVRAVFPWNHNIEFEECMERCMVMIELEYGDKMAKDRALGGARYES